MTIYLVTFFYSCLSVNGQDQGTADSLIQILERSDLDDSIKLRLLHGIVRYSADPEQRFRYSNDLLFFSRDIGNEKYRAIAYEHLGISQRLKGSLDQSLEALFKGAEIAVSINENQILGRIYAEIATCYTQNNELEKALIFDNKAIEIFRESNSYQDLALNLLNTGYNYYLIDSLDMALDYYDEAIPIFERINLIIGKAYILGNTGLVYAKLGRTEKAEEQLTEAIEILTGLDDSYAITEFQIEMASIYQQKGDYKTAEKYLVEALAYAEEDGLQERIRDASLKLSELYEIKGDFKNAFFYQKQYLTYRDSINNEEVIRKMADLRTEFEVGQKQVEVDLLHQEAKTQRILLIGVVAVLILVFILAYVLYKLYKLRDRAIKISRKRRQVISAQRNELADLNRTKDKFFSIISHDIRAPVNNFQGVAQLINLYVESGDTQELVRLADMMEKSSTELSTLLDNLLDWAMSQQGRMPYKPELFSMSELCDSSVTMMENLAESKGLTLNRNIEEHVVLEADRNSVSTVIRNLLNNAIKFTEKGGVVGVSLSHQEDSVQLRIEDSGVGIEPDKLERLFSFKGERTRWGTAGEKGVGLGLNLVHEFVEMNRGTITVESELDVGTTFVVTFPHTV